MATEWIRPLEAGAAHIWGFKNGIQVGIWPADIEGGSDGGPRGLFRIGYPILDGGKRAGLVNFVAVEPVVNGSRGLSELEHSDINNRQGKLFWTGDSFGRSAKVDAGTIDTNGKTLRVKVYVERFVNGAEPVVELQFASAHPSEVQFHVTSRGARMERCVLTATMGNYMRLRQLHLKDHVVHPRDLWPNFTSSPNGFTEDAFFPAHMLPTNRAGDLLVNATTDETDPHSQPADAAAPWWRYRGSFPLTQYWRVPKGKWSDSLRLRVNGRCVYWAGDRPIPGGMAFENFDLVEPFVENQVLVFGLDHAR